MSIAIAQLFEYRFIDQALVAAALVAVIAAPMGWLMVVRRESFAGHTLSMMAFPGAAAGALLGVPAALGYAAFCGGGALLLPAQGGRGGRESGVATALVQVLALAAGFLLVSLYGGELGDLESLLFGNLLAVSSGQLLALAICALAVVASLAVLGRRVLLASVDPVGSAARGTSPARTGRIYLLLLAVTVAATSTVTGPLLVFALLVAPAAAAQGLTANPLWSLALAVLFGLLVALLGVAVSFYLPYPAAFFIAAFAFLLYVAARLLARGRRRR